MLSTNISKEQTTQAQMFFWFLVFVVMILCGFKKPKNKKNSGFFCFFEMLVDSIYAKKKQKTQVFCFWLFKSQKNKNTEGKPKKTCFESKPNILFKSLFFWCFGFWWFLPSGETQRTFCFVVNNKKKTRKIKKTKNSSKTKKQNFWLESGIVFDCLFACFFCLFSLNSLPTFLSRSACLLSTPWHGSECKTKSSSPMPISQVWQVRNLELDKGC